MFRLGEITKAVGGQLFSGDPRLRINGVSIDSRTIKDGELFVAIRGGRFDGHDFIQEVIHKGAKAIIIQDSGCRLPHTHKIPYIKVIDTRRALADLARFHRQRFSIPLIAVTGSNGKTTTKDILAWLLSSHANVLKNPGTQNNDIGVPLILLKLDISYDIGVLELGTNHFGEIAYLANIVQPNFGIITNIGPAHLEYLRNLSGVYKEKVNLLKNLKSPKIAILNADEPRFARLKKDEKTFVVTYGINNKCDFQATSIKLTSKKTIEFLVNARSPRGKLRNSNYESGDSPEVTSSCRMEQPLRLPIRPHRQRIQLNTIGHANIYNALAAIVVARLLGWDYESIRQRLATFVFPEGRLKPIKLNGISFIDDTYNANPASLSEALGILSRFRVNGRKIFVMGDMLELGASSEEFHRQAGIQIARTCDVFIGVGRFSQFAAHWACKSGLSKDRVFSCQDSQKAGNLLFKTLKPNHRDLILVKGSRLMKMEKVLRSV